MKISIIHPSRGRPEQAIFTKHQWLSKAANSEIIQYIIVADQNDPKLWEYQQMGTIAVSSSPGSVHAINFGAKLSIGDILIVVSDDFDCPPHWDTLLLTALQGKKDYCVKTEDGSQGFIITLPIMDRAYYNRFGYIYNPAYDHMFADTEMSCVAWMLDKYVTVPLRFKHDHYSTGAVAKDAINVKNDATWDQGKAVFKRRYNENFGIVPVRPLPEHSGIVKYMQTV